MNDNERLAYLESLIFKGETLPDEALIHYGLKKKIKDQKERKPYKRIFKHDFMRVDETLKASEIAKAFNCAEDTARQMKYRKLASLGMKVEKNKDGRYKVGSRKKLNQNQIDAIIEMYDQGIILRIIAETLSITITGVHYQVMKYRPGRIKK
jgi:hypothetical protein